MNQQNTRYGQTDLSTYMVSGHFLYNLLTSENYEGLWKQNSSENPILSHIEILDDFLWKYPVPYFSVLCVLTTILPTYEENYHQTVQLEMRSVSRSCIT